jgi:hypothetical protein
MMIEFSSLDEILVTAFMTDSTSGRGCEARAQSQWRAPVPTRIAVSGADGPPAFGKLPGGMPRAAICLLTVIITSIVVLVADPAPATAQGRTLGGLLSTVQGHLDQFWRGFSAQRGFAYSTPRIHHIGPGQAARNSCSAEPVQRHMYCGGDRTIYLDVSSNSFVSLGSLWTGNKDFSIVQVVAHEWGHHIQSLRGILARQSPQINVELQADCLSGMFTRWAQAQGYLEPGDYQEAIWILSHAWGPNHGTGPQRVAAFQDGFQNPGRVCLL